MWLQQSSQYWVCDCTRDDNSPTHATNGQDLRFAASAKTDIECKNVQNSILNFIVTKLAQYTYSHV